MKLTDAQLELLREVKDGDDLCATTYPEAIRIVDKGLCTWGEPAGPICKRLVITDAGRQALKDMEGKP